jgi:radical SAM protein with 4Fe4S-binding SPASM domain
MRPSERLFALSRENRVPLTVIFELTRRCNLRCRHCYIDQDEKRKPELSTAAVKRILRELAAAGTLNLVFTGGEIFLRRDLLELCRYARGFQFNLVLFTNGTLLTRRAAQRLAALGINDVEVSLYGREQVHESITREPGSFERTTQAVSLLTSAGIKATVKSPLMRLNFKEYHWLLSFAAEHGAVTQFDPTITAKDNGDRTFLGQRLNCGQLASLYSDRKLYLPSKGRARVADDDFICSAAVNLATVGHDGTLYPCLQLPLPLGDLQQRPFAELWRKENPAVAAYLAIGASDLEGCAGCRLLPLCQRCPGMAMIEDGSLTGPSKIACRIAGVIEKVRNAGGRKNVRRLKRKGSETASLWGNRG